MRTIWLLVAVLVVTLSAFGQGLVLPGPNDPWWKSDTGKAFAAREEKWMADWAASTNEQDRILYREYFEGTHQYPCLSTTMDGLPNCPLPKMTSLECLKVGPPDEVGGYCDWYGYSTLKQEDRFERKRGYVRVRHKDASGDTWKKIR
jgi:hypothetical protein